MTRLIDATLIVPMLNEEANIDLLIDRLRAQSLCPNELLVIDAGSTDGTVERLQQRAGELPSLRVEVLPGARPGRGRNIGAQLATNPILLFTDAGIDFGPDWAESLTKPLIDARVEVALGGYTTDAESAFDRCAELLTCCESEEVDGRRAYFPTTASLAITRSAFLRLGGFPEGLVAFEDALFFEGIGREQVAAMKIPKALVRWTMGRGLANLLHKARRNGHGEAQGGIISRRTIFVTILMFALLLVSLSPVPFLAKAAVLALGAAWRLQRLRKKNPNSFLDVLKCPLGLVILLPLTVLADLGHLLGYGRSLLGGIATQGVRVLRPRVFNPVRISLDARDDKELRNSTFESTRDRQR